MVVPFVNVFKARWFQMQPSDFSVQSDIQNIFKHPCAETWPPWTPLLYIYIYCIYNSVYMSIYLYIHIQYIYIYIYIYIYMYTFWAICSNSKKTNSGGCPKGHFSWGIESVPVANRVLENMGRSNVGLTQCHKQWHVVRLVYTNVYTLWKPLYNLTEDIGDMFFLGVYHIIPFIPVIRIS